MLDLGHVNLWAIFFSGTAGSVLAYLWYCPTCLGKLWKNQFKESPFWIYFINILAAFVLAYTLAQLIFFIDAKGMVTGALVGFSLWAFFTITTALIDIFTTKRNPVTYILNFGYQLLSMVLMGGILGLLR